MSSTIRRHWTDEAIQNKIEHLLTKMVIKDNGEDWSRREKALIETQRFIIKIMEIPGGSPNSSPSGSAPPEENLTTWLSKDLSRKFVRALSPQLKDLRSAIVRESCKLLEIMADKVGGACGAVISPILTSLMELSANGNKIISSYSDACLYSVVEKVHVPKTLSRLASHAMHSKSKDMRECCIKCVDIAFASYSTEEFIGTNSQHHETIKHLQACVVHALSDASSDARRYARRAFVHFAHHFPEESERLLGDMENKTAERLRQEMSRKTDGKRSPVFNSHASPDTTSKGHQRSGSGLRRSGSSGHKRSESGVRSRLSSGLRRSSSGSSDHKRSESKGTDSDSPDKSRKSLSFSKNKSPVKSKLSSSHSKSSSLTDIIVDGRVFVKLKGVVKEAIGTVRFVGKTSFREGEWIGVELDNNLGKGDGIVQGETYFKCEKGKGVFVRRSSVEVIGTNSGGEKREEVSGNTPVKAPSAAKQIRRESRPTGIPSPRAVKSVMRTAKEESEDTGCMAQKNNVPPKNNIAPPKNNVTVPKQNNVPVAQPDDLSHLSFPDVLKCGENILKEHRGHIDDVLACIREEMKRLVAFEALSLSLKEEDNPNAENESEYRLALLEYVSKMSSAIATRNAMTSKFQK